MRIPLFHRFSFRLSVLFLALLVALGGALVWIAVDAVDRATVVADQALHRDLARDLAPRFQPHLETDIDTMAISGIIGGLTQVNRRLDVYLLGSNGMIKSWFMDARKRPLVGQVDTTPLDAFIDGGRLPLLSADPARPDQLRPFSVAHVRIMGEEGCYLYLILEGERYDDVADVLQREAIVGTVVRGVGLALGLAGLVGVVVFAFLTRRLGRLTETVGAFERGARSVRAPEEGHDEVGVLAGAFNRMATRIEEQLDELEKTDALRRALVEGVSHDLRSPVASLRGYLETLHMRPASPPHEREEHLARALRAAERMSTLIGDLFDLARFDAAEIRVAPEPVALAELAHDVVAEYQAGAERENVRLNLCAEDGLPLVRLDAGLAERALVNLLDNALRHTSAGGSIEVAVVSARDCVELRVRDTGEGIAPEVLPHVFERFVRADPSRPADGGAGLGLAIVRRIATLHGGTVRAQSTPGEGATFGIAFPVEGPPVEGPPVGE